MNDQATMTKRQRPVRARDICAGMWALCETMNDWWRLKGDAFTWANWPPLPEEKIDEDDEREAESPSPEVLSEVVALFVARWRNSQLLRANPYDVVAFDERVKDALAGKFDNHPTMDF